MLAKIPKFKSRICTSSNAVVSAIDLRPSPRKEFFGLRFRGYLRVPATGVYGFHLSSDDGSRLILDGQTVADNDEIHGMGERTGWVGLAAGFGRRLFFALKLGNAIAHLVEHAVQFRLQLRERLKGVLVGLGTDSLARPAR